MRPLLAEERHPQARRAARGGVHVHEDMTAARDELAERFPHVTFRLAEPLGRHPLLLDVVEQRAAEAEGDG